MSLSQETLLELMAFADDELEAGERARIEQLVLENDEARRVVEAIRAPEVGAFFGAFADDCALGSEGIADAVMTRIASSTSARPAAGALASAGRAGVSASVGSGTGVSASVGVSAGADATAAFGVGAEAVPGAGGATSGGLGATAVAGGAATGAGSGGKVASLDAGRKRSRVRMGVAAAALVALAAGVAVVIGSTRSGGPEAPVASMGAPSVDMQPPPSVLAAHRPLQGVEVDEVDSPSRAFSVFEIPIGGGNGAAANAAGPSSVVIMIDDDPGAK